MTLRVSLVPLGRVEARLIAGLAEALAGAGFEAQVLAARALAPEAFDAERGQWRAEPLLALLAEEPGQRVLGVTEHDLYAAGLSFVFGIAQCPGRTALISLARLGEGGDEAVLLERARKEAVHELGHASGLGHCADPRCVMHLSNRLADTDLKHAEPCPRCAEALHGEDVRLLVTARGFGTVRDARRALREAVPGARILGTGFVGILVVETRGDAHALAARVAETAHAGGIGRVMLVLADVESERQPIEAAAVALGRHRIRPGESFCFRLHKRGAHGLAETSLALEREIGGAVWTALRERDGKDPRVDLARPDVTLSAEVLGPRTLLCLRRRAWLHEPASSHA